MCWSNRHRFVTSACSNAAWLPHVIGPRPQQVFVAESQLLSWGNWLSPRYAPHRALGWDWITKIHWQRLYDRPEIAFWVKFGHILMYLSDLGVSHLSVSTVLIQSICCTLWPVTNVTKFWFRCITGEGVTTRKIHQNVRMWWEGIGFYLCL